MTNHMRTRRRKQLASTLASLKSNPSLFQGNSGGYEYSGGYGPVDIWGTQPTPKSSDLINQYKGIAYSCATTNAQAVARVPRRLYVQTTKRDDPPSKVWRYRKLDKGQQKHIDLNRKRMGISMDAEVEEVMDHPLIDLMHGASTFFGAFTLTELTDLYQEFDGNAYWRLERNGAGMPSAVYILQSQFVTPNRDPETNMIISYTYGAEQSSQIFSADDIIHFRFPNLRDPYGCGWSPARACWESLNIMNKDHSFASSYMDNRIRPDAIVAPKSDADFMTPKQEERLDRTLQRKFRKGGAGGTVVWGSALNITPLSFNSKDMEMLKRYGATKIEVMNCYGVPPALMDSMKSRAELNAAQAQHARQAVAPRVMRQDEQLNIQLVSKYSDRLFFLSDDAVPADIAQALVVREANLKAGFTVINEERLEDGRSAVPWGAEPWMPNTVSQPSKRTSDTTPPPAEGEPPIEDDEVDEPLVDPDAAPDTEDDNPEGDPEKGIPSGMESFYNDVLKVIRQHPQGIDPWDVLEALGDPLGRSVHDVGRAAGYWVKLGLLRG